MDTEERDKMLYEIHTVLLGANGDEGLVGEFSCLKKSHGKLKIAFWSLVSFLSGAGILTSSYFTFG